ncbi:hypothetical protein FOQG_10927 [Fusarium oxysporum f. sp. raphani 54005]|uniref:Acetylserotonin methytransferase-like protein n=8 Tax=Fusarium oxysporum TaxID=5507 RepID=X0BRZ7_FUSOX|nr:hypothetical protein FOXG_05694 [Fusarium oxysporum f. sp. lycopersici 4287]EGU79021.1 hypothetical protein FOXB_10450 [Fusarium oxysporum f. sp. conglutinans Fo5176]EXK32668.1 hypothetical protein FOMG_11550 [Fusarium oxysporum f. sp. melonis 26406]EXK84965.1 hypothetical protein FOQG_10927 [Fusarium oxysporum f. sp. raphani 54005]EXL71648.1 hypothetical protein FOPG_12616 [Fusarium oxysporum f. sp. conglutinans race 2 54008]KAF6521773.1 hypothetical protein HZS61_013301 [Fusarium oxysporu
MSTPTPGGFSLFPSPNSSKPPPVSRNQTPKPRRSESRERRAPTPSDRRAPTPSDRRAATPQAMTPEPRPASPRNGRQTPQNRAHTPIEFEPVQSEPPKPVKVQRPRPTVQIPGRSDTGFAQGNTLVRSSSDRSRSSIAKPPLGGETTAQPLRSIFPAYNPEVPLGQQNYVPTEIQPTQMPRAVISRQTYHETPAGSAPRNPVRSPVISPMSVQSAQSSWPHRNVQQQEPPLIPTVSSNEQLKNYWKVANGWQASPSEGRVYCMKLAQEKDAPVYSLSSASQPFYNLRIDPTSASAYVTLTRHDPNKPYKAPKPEASSSASSIISGVVGHNSNSSGTKVTDTKHWQEALTTTLEEESRRHPPNDGLVALLMPTPATKMAIERAQDPQSVMLAERECARLVWDEDSSHHFLVHPSLATPFCVTIERSPSWSRVEYTLEHNESPQHLAKLTRDGTGGGWLEIDTGIAAKIESYFIVDVAVTALLLVASADEKNTPAMEVFEPPPPLILTAKQEKRLSKIGKRDERKKRHMESFEIDVESQDESLGKSKPREKEDKLPFLIRVIVKIVKGLFACFIWILTISFKCVGFAFKGCYKCVGSKY